MSNQPEEEYVSAARVKDWAISIGSTLSSIESETGRCMGMVMQAASQGQPGVAQSAQRAAEDLEKLVTELQDDLKCFRQSFDE